MDITVWAWDGWGLRRELQGHPPLPPALVRGRLAPPGAAAL
jgi:hypothetical protein